MKDKIINLVGASGSGKTTIAKELERLGYNIIYSYTTRNPRKIDEWGHTFIGKKDYAENYDVSTNYMKYEQLYKYSPMIAHREIYDEVYFATKDQYQNKGSSIYVVCPDGARQVKQNVKDAEVLTIYLQCDEYIRMCRMNEDKTRTAKSVSDRLEKDRDVFRVCECDYVVSGNRDLKNVIESILNIINK